MLELPMVNGCEVFVEFYDDGKAVIKMKSETRLAHNRAWAQLKNNLAEAGWIIRSVNVNVSTERGIKADEQNG